MSKPIDCNIHDHFEIACMRRAEIKLELHSKEVLRGLAIDVYAKQGKEYLSLAVNDDSKEIDLSDIVALTFTEDGKRIDVF